MTASLQNTSISGTASWLIQGTLEVANVYWTTPKIETRAQNGLVAIENSAFTQGSVTAGYLGRVNVNTSTFNGTALHAGSPSAVYPIQKAPTSGRMTLASSGLEAGSITTQFSSTLAIASSQIEASAITVAQLNTVTLTASELTASPISLTRSTFEVAATTLRSSPITIVGGTTEIADGTVAYVAADGTGITVNAGVLELQGEEGSPVVLSGVCDPTNTRAPQACQENREEVRPATLVALRSGSEITADGVVFAMARTAVDMDPMTKGAAQTELSTTRRGIFNSDFILTDDAVTFAPNWSATACRFDTYLPVTDSYFHKGHQWNVNVTRFSSNGFEAYSNGTADYSGIARGELASEFSQGKWLSSLTGNPDHEFWEAPNISNRDYSSLVFDALVNYTAHDGEHFPENTNMLPYYTQTCSFSVPTKPLASSMGIPVAAPRLTTPAVPWGSDAQDVLVDGIETPNHGYTQQLSDALGIGDERSFSEFVPSTIPVLMLPDADLQRVYPSETASFEPQEAPQPGVLKLSRTSEGDPVLTASWGAPASSRVLGYHVELSRDGASWDRLTPALGIPGRYNTLHKIACSYTDDCYVRIVTIGWDGESYPGDVAFRERAPWLR
jgi:hypothetical protein